MRQRGERRSRSWWMAVVAGVVALVSASPAAGQVAWDAPLLVHPHAPSGFSAFLAEPFPGDEFALLGQWRSSAVPTGLGVRAGLGEDPVDGLAVFGGVDMSGTVVRYSEEVPVDVIWVVGAGLGAGENVVLSAPAALIAGWDLQAEDVSFRPYVGPKVVLDAFFDSPGDDVELELSLDFGMDVDFGNQLYVRFGASLLDRDALALGVSLPGIGR